MFKFKRGNLVRVGNSKISAVVEYSYAEKYGAQFESDNRLYSLISLSNGHSSFWHNEEELTLIDEGGEHLIVQAQKTLEEKVKLDTDLSYILTKLESGELSSASILYLFNLIGFESHFETTGEWSVLLTEWFYFYPLFLHIFKSRTLDEALSGLNRASIGRLNIEAVFEAFQEELKKQEN